jgi:hypothetical protein
LLAQCQRFFGFAAIHQQARKMHECRGAVLVIGGQRFVVHGERLTEF